MTSRKIQQKIELHFNDGFDVFGQNGQFVRVFGEFLQRIRVPMQSVFIASFLLVLVELSHLEREKMEFRI